MHTPTGRERLVVAMSGGVDSSLTAALLQAQGHEVIGVSLQTHALEPGAERRFGGCCSSADLRDARRVAEHLDIPHYVLNITDAFRAAVIDEFIDEYLAGRTPNPCVRCNQRIKFDLLLERAREFGARAVATGHYARRSWEEQSGRYALHRGRDAGKDQSYVLFGLSQRQLEGLRFPLGDYTKAEVRALASEFGLPVARKPESQEICFVPHNDYAAWLASEAPERLPGPGDIVDAAGRLLGRHRGVPFYTVGQRRGLGLGAGRTVAPEEENGWRAPLYVQRLEPQLNLVVVGPQTGLQRRRCQVAEVSWMAPPDTAVRQAEVQIRAHHHPGRARIDVDLESRRACVTFEAPQRAITPGQAAVFYDGDRLLGGGWVDDVEA